MPEDELLTHQIVDTFATVSQSDPSWTEKIWTIAHARDNSLQVVLGIGKYTNRGVFDGAAGVCRGTEQWTVRAGRRLSSDSAGTHVGPIHYRVVEPLRAIQVSLDATEHAPIAFDVELRGDFDAALEDPWPDRSPGRLPRHPQRAAIPPDRRCVGLGGGRGHTHRDRSRQMDFDTGPLVGSAPRCRQADTGPAARRPQDQADVHDLAADDDDPPRRIELFAVRHVPGGAWRRLPRDPLSGRAAERRRHAHRFASVEQDMHFQDDNRRFTHGTVTLIDTDGTKRPLTITAAGPTGFHLGTAGYYGWNDWVYGQWVGDLKVEGNHVDRL